MVEIDRPREIFAAAWALYSDAIQQLDNGKLRNPAEKAWGATKRATDALILARTGREPRTAGRTTRAIRELRRGDDGIFQLSLRFDSGANILNGGCFYDGNCEPEDELARDIRETSDYIRDAESPAAA